MNKCIYVEKTKTGQERIVHGQCDHSEYEHKNGTCWHIVNPEFDNQDNINKYCKCVQNPGNIKPYVLIGYTPIGHEDWMIPKTCNDCNNTLLLRVDKDICVSCEINTNFK